VKRHKDLVLYLKSKGLRMTDSKKALIQFFLDHKNRHVPLKEVNAYMSETLPEIDRATIYRNLEKFVALGVIQQLELPREGKVFQFVFDKKVHHYYICKSCGEMNKGNQELFTKIDEALKAIPDFSRANLSVVFYGACSDCQEKFDL